MLPPNILPLDQTRILITRTRTQASELAVQLEALGAETILIPTIEIGPPEDDAALRTTLNNLADFDWLILTSANAAEVLAGHIIRPTLKVAVVGPATARAVQQHGIRVDLIPPAYTADSLLEALLPHAPGVRMLLLRAAVARDLLPEALRAAGAQLTIATAYRNIIPAGSIEALAQLFADPTRHPSAITFTSASTATNLAELLRAADITLPDSIVRASIGPITTAALNDLGLPPTIEARESTIPSLVEAITEHFSAL